MSPGAKTPASPSFSPGAAVLGDRYVIQSLVGRGAFGEVYLATHRQLNARRALKVLRRDAPGLGSTLFNDFLDRFRLEARLGSQLNHPNLVRVFDFIQEDDFLVLVLEYAPGGSLAERLNKTRILGVQVAIEQALRWGVEIAAGLSAIHALDAVHRDLKPSNILFDAKDHAKVADLGLAQVPGGPSYRSLLSEPRPHPGTPGFMSPEQEHSGAYLSPASDIYALGLVLFECLTLRSYKSQRPGTLPSALRAGLSGQIDELLGRMLAEDPKERPWNGEEAAALLKKAGGSASTAAPPPADAQSQPGASTSSNGEALKTAIHTAIQLGEWEEAGRLLEELKQAAPAEPVVRVFQARIQRELEAIRQKKAEEEEKRRVTEQARLAEKSRLEAAEAEKKRKASEQARLAEQARAAAEAEQNRKVAEQARLAEQARAAAEAEQKRKAAEEAERKRKEAEQAELTRKLNEDAERLRSLISPRSSLNSRFPPLNSQPPTTRDTFQSYVNSQPPYPTNPSSTPPGQLPGSGLPGTSDWRLNFPIQYTKPTFKERLSDGWHAFWGRIGDRLSDLKYTRTGKVVEIIGAVIAAVGILLWGLGMLGQSTSLILLGVFILLPGVIIANWASRRR